LWQGEVKALYSSEVRLVSFTSKSELQPSWWLCYLHIKSCTNNASAFFRVIADGTEVLPCEEMHSYCARVQIVRFAYVTSLWVEGKQTHVLCKLKTLLKQETRQRAAKNRRREIMLREWTVCASLSAAPPTPLFPCLFLSNGPQSHRFAPTTVPPTICSIYM
jgi:hypothetical protein